MFNKNITYLRKNKNITQEELAKALSVSRQTISKWEKGEVVPDSYNLIEISKYFSIKVQDLIMTDLSEIYDVKSDVEELPEEANVDIKVETQIDESIDSQDNKNAKIKSSKKKIIFILVLIVGLISIIFSFKDQLFGSKNEVIINEPIQEPEVELKDYTKLLSAGREFSVYIDQNGKVVGVGDNTYKQLNFENWSDIVQISAGGFHTLGLKNDGTVVATGYNNFKQIDVGTWSNIKQVSGGRYHSLGLKEDGTVLCVGENQYGACNVSSWSDIIQVSAGRYNSYGLKSDGSVVSTENNEYGQANITTWSDIKQLSSGTYHVVGLKSDGSVVCAGGQKGDGVCNVSSWSDIKQVVGAGYHSIGLKNDGTVVAVGNNERGQLDVSGWKDVVAVSGGRYHTIGLTKENQFLSLGLDDSENVIITGEEDNDPNDNDAEDETTIPESDIDYLNEKNINVKLEITESEANLKNVLYNPLTFNLKFTGVIDKYIISVQCGSGSGMYVYEYETTLINEKSNGNLDVSKYIISRCYYADVTFKISEILGYTDSRDFKISKWYEVDGKYIASKDFDNLFLTKSNLFVDSNFIAYSDIPGRFDISKKSDGSDLDLKELRNKVYNFDSSGLSIKTVLSTYNDYYKNSNIPDDFNIDNSYYACSSVGSRLNSDKLITKCVEFKLDSVRFGLMKAVVPGNPNELFTFTRKWMFNQTNYNYKILIEIPELEYSTEVVRYIPGSGPIGIPIVTEIKQNSGLVLKEDWPERVKIYVSISVVNNNKYLESLPYQYTLEVNTSDLVE